MDAADSAMYERTNRYRLSVRGVVRGQPRLGWDALGAGRRAVRANDRTNQMLEEP